MSIRVIEIDNDTLTFLLGFLTPEQWKDTLLHYSLDRDVIKALYEVQKKEYDLEIGLLEKELNK